MKRIICFFLTVLLVITALPLNLNILAVQNYYPAIDFSVLTYRNWVKADNGIVNTNTEIFKKGIWIDSADSLGIGDGKLNLLGMCPMDFDSDNVTDCVSVLGYDYNEMNFSLGFNTNNDFTGTTAIAIRINNSENTVWGDNTYLSLSPELIDNNGNYYALKNADEITDSNAISIYAQLEPQKVYSSYIKYKGYASWQGNKDGWYIFPISVFEDGFDLSNLKGIKLTTSSYYDSTVTIADIGFVTNISDFVFEKVGIWPYGYEEKVIPTKMSTLDLSGLAPGSYRDTEELGFAGIIPTDSDIITQGIWVDTEDSKGFGEPLTTGKTNIHGFIANDDNNDGIADSISAIPNDNNGISFTLGVNKNSDFSGATGIAVHLDCDHETKWTDDDELFLTLTMYDSNGTAYTFKPQTNVNSAKSYYVTLDDKKIITTDINSEGFGYWLGNRDGWYILDLSAFNGNFDLSDIEKINFYAKSTWDSYMTIADVCFVKDSEQFANMLISENSYQEPPKEPTLKVCGGETVILAYQDGMEYSMDGVRWSSSNTFTGLDTGDTYEFYQRLVETEESFASSPSQPLTVTLYEQGDVDHNDVLNAYDLTEVRKHLLNVKTASDTYAADANIDGKIDIIDLIRIKKSIALDGFDDDEYPDYLGYNKALDLSNLTAGNYYFDGSFADTKGVWLNSQNITGLQAYDTDGDNKTNLLEARIHDNKVASFTLGFNTSDSYSGNTAIAVHIDCEDSYEHRGDPNAGWLGNSTAMSYITLTLIDENAKEIPITPTSNAYFNYVDLIGDLDYRRECQYQYEWYGVNTDGWFIVDLAAFNVLNLKTVKGLKFSFLNTNWNNVGIADIAFIDNADDFVNYLVNGETINPTMFISNVGVHKPIYQYGEFFIDSGINTYGVGSYDKEKVLSSIEYYNLPNTAYSLWPADRGNVAEWGYTFFLTTPDGAGTIRGKGGFDPTPVTRRNAIDQLKKWMVSSYNLANVINKGFEALNGHYPWQHYAAELGASAVGVETGETISSPQSRIAFTRGAAKQYGIPWFCDFSYWYLNRDRGYLKDMPADHGENWGHSHSLHERMFILSYMGGAGYFMCEDAVGQNFWETKTTTDGYYELTDGGKVVQKYYDFTKREKDVGIQYVPFGILMDREHGSYTGDDIISERKAFQVFDYTKADDMNMEIMQKFFPDTNGVADYYLYETNFLTNSPYGESCDVILQNASQKVLNSYPCLIMSGDLSDASAAEKIRYLKYVKQGGILVMNTAYLDLFPDYKAKYDNSGKMEITDEQGKVIIYGGDYDTSKLDEILAELSEKFMPFEISGDADYIINIKNGSMFVTVINNKGVYKPSNYAEWTVNSATTDVTVTYKGDFTIKSVEEVYEQKEMQQSQNSIKTSLAPGEINILKFTF